MVTVAVSVPPALEAVIVNTVDEIIADGVPDITPFVVEKVRPVGNDGDIDHVTTAPPPKVGVAAVIAVPLVKE